MALGGKTPFLYPDETDSDRKRGQGCVAAPLTICFEEEGEIIK